MTESFVDLVYRGLPLARHARLTAVRPTEAYVESAAPMPVGTALQVSTEDGLTFDAKVTGVTEQTGGAMGVPGMQIAPALEGAASAWWSARVALPDAPPAPRRLVVQPTAPVVAPVARTVTAPFPAPPAPAAPSVEPSTAPPADAMEASTIPMPIIDPAPDLSAPEIIIEDHHDKRTRVMEAVVAEALLEQVAAEGAPAPAPVVDDGKRTQVMAAVDLSALGLETSASGSLRLPTASDAEEPEPDADADKSKPTAAAGKKPKRKRR